MKIRAEGFKANNYDAKYDIIPIIYEEKIEERTKYIKIVEPNSGWELCFNLPLDLVETPRQKPKRNQFNAYDKKIYHKSNCKPNDAPIIFVKGRNDRENKRGKNGVQSGKPRGNVRCDVQQHDSEKRHKG